MEGEVVETIRKSPESMTVAELQAEIGRLQAILHYKVCGDPRHFVSVGAGGVLRGCVCPAGTEKSCQGLNCPRRSYGELRAS